MLLGFEVWFLMLRRISLLVAVSRSRAAKSGGQKHARVKSGCFITMSSRARYVIRR